MRSCACGDADYPHFRPTPCPRTIEYPLKRPNRPTLRNRHRQRNGGRYTRQFSILQFGILLVDPFAAIAAAHHQSPDKSTGDRTPWNRDRPDVPILVTGPASRRRPT